MLQGTDQDAVPAAARDFSCWEATLFRFTWKAETAPILLGKNIHKIDE
ncbi:hypothetical protein [Agrobacterium tumefaciens]|nr:hypothetical protein [Agrobacterium tumefaciens]MDS7597247.1 hypothetical protein [Agrobacterium tumefaciens]